MRTAAIFAGLLLCACAADPRSARGFRLPDDGDVRRGHQAFVEHGCNTCHAVSGAAMPAPRVRPPVPVVLGGETPFARTDGELVTEIVNPSYRIAGGYAAHEVQVEGVSRMPDLGERLSARDLVDIVAFLQDRYHVVRPHRFEGRGAVPAAKH